MLELEKFSEIPLVNYLVMAHTANIYVFLSYTTLGERNFPTPGNELLPTFGFCDVRESSKDMKQVVTNKHRFICEVSPHSLYQYTFIVTWFFMIFSTFIALLGFVIQVADHTFTIPCFLRADENARFVLMYLILTAVRVRDTF